MNGKHLTAEQEEEFWKVVGRKKDENEDLEELVYQVEQYNKKWDRSLRLVE